MAFRAKGGHMYFGVLNKVLSIKKRKQMLTVNVWGPGWLFNFSPQDQTSSSSAVTRSVLLISERNARHVIGILRYLERANALLPPELLTFAQGVQMAREDQKTDRPLCRYLKSFGVCRSPDYTRLCGFSLVHWSGPYSLVCRWVCLSHGWLTGSRLSHAGFFCQSDFYLPFFLISHIVACVVYNIMSFRQ